MGKKTKETTKKIQKLLNIMNTTALQPKPKEKFKTKEVVILIIITTLISITLGATLTYKHITNKETKIETELQEFINNYQYIIENYNGEINKQELLDAALEGILNKLDKNSNYLDSDTTQNFNTYLEGEYQGIGIEVYQNKDQKIIINQVIKNSPAEKAGLQKNDIITKINNKKTTVNDFIKTIEKNKTVKITYIRNNQEYTKELKTSSINLQSATSKIYTQNNKKIGYIQITIFASNTYEQFKSQLDNLNNQQINQLIIDLRDNSGGYLSVAENIISLFLSSSHPIYQIQKDNTTTKHYSKGKQDTNLKIFILTNNSSASASEILASSLKEQIGAVIIGEKTYGKGTVQELQNLTSGNKYKLTTKNWLTSKGTWIEGKGIKPDINIPLSENYTQNPTEENDNQLQTALKEASK